METDIKSEIGNYKLSDQQKLVIQTLIIILGAALRLFVYSTDFPKPADVLGYMDDARFILGQEDSYSYPKEIGFPFFLAVIGTVFGISYRVARISSVLIGVINIILSAIATRAIMKRWNYSETFSYNASLFVSFLVSISSTIFKSDNRGVREPLYTLLLLSLMIILHTPDQDKKTLLTLFLLTFSMGLIKTEFQYVGIGLAFLLFIEAKQQGYEDFSLKSKVIAIGAIIAYISWRLMAIWLIGDNSSTDNFYISGMVERLDPGLTPGGGWSWFIFSYLGLPKFTFYVFSGAIRLIHALPQMIGLIVFILVILGGKDIIKSSRVTIPLLYVGVAFFNGLVAYFTNLIGLDRIVSVYFPLIFIYAGISVMKITSFNIRLTPNRKVEVPPLISLLFLTISILLESIIWNFGIPLF